MSAGTDDFARVNVIYGGNGSGKSTLARVFAQMSGRDLTDLEVQLEESGPDRTTRRIKDRADSFWSRVRVFNKDFVSRNLLFDVEGRSDVLPLLVLGEPNVERDKRLAEINPRLEAIPGELSEAQKAFTEATRAANKLATDTARTISQELQPAGGRYESRKYDARRLKEALLSIDLEADSRSDSEMAADLRVVQGRRMEPVGLIQPVRFDLRCLEEQVSEVLGQTITSTALDELVGDASAERWVQRGVQLHEHRGECLFCASPVTPERRRALDKHFDESFKRLQDRVSALDRSLESEHAAVAEPLTFAPDRGRLYSDLHENHDKAMRSQEEAIVEYQRRVVSLRSALAEKQASPFSVVRLSALPGRAELSFEQVNELLSRHNARSADYQKVVAAAARRVESGRLAAIADTYRESQQRAQTNSELAENLQGEQERLEQERTSLNVTELDASPLAEELTRDVACLLGRDELVFANQDGKYSIERHGEPATALSEGERTAISLLYFLCSLRDEQTKDLDATVIIDDPVSSLDQEILVGASSHLWSALVGNGAKHQVLLLTHSFELFRMWSNQLDRLPPQLKKLCPYSIYELRTRYKEVFDGSARRAPVLLSWTDKKLRTKLRSQYHYLFWRIADVLREENSDGDLAKEMEATAVIPNAARQMLEAFLAFKYPSKLGDFEGSMRRAFREQSVSDPLRQRITRFVHRQSHNEEANIDRPVGIGESVTVLRSVFEFIEAVDADHFNEMCAALELTPSVVLSRAPVPAGQN
ncbi:AAA family ATPase [Brevibacterium sp. GP-SGM9]|uniref:AAA family ATPase n=1 Tax=Brevibacterium sp. GP-SGM9 TaxID=3376990 RepID=UPI0039A4CB13